MKRKIPMTIIGSKIFSSLTLVFYDRIFVSDSIYYILYFIPKPILAEEIQRKGRIGRSIKFASSF